MRRDIFLLLLPAVCVWPGPAGAGELLSLEIFAGSEYEAISVEWPFDGPPAVGDPMKSKLVVDQFLAAAGVDCPPERVQISDTIWKCGNGQLIRVKDSRLGSLFARAWR